MPDLIVLPDVIAPSIRFLATVTQVTDLVADRIGTQLAEKAVWPAVRIDPIGGLTPLEYRLDQPNLQVHAFDLDDMVAMTVARTLKAAFSAMAGYHEPGVLVVVDVVTSSPQLIDDRDRTPKVSHATFTATVTVRPDP